MRKMSESCQGTTTNHTAGNTSQTGNYVLNRTLKNTPPSEAAIRGITVHRENLEFFRSVHGENVDYAIQAGLVQVI